MLLVLRKHGEKIMVTALSSIVCWLFKPKIYYGPTSDGTLPSLLFFSFAFRYTHVYSSYWFALRNGACGFFLPLLQLPISDFVLYFFG